MSSFGRSLRGARVNASIELDNNLVANGDPWSALALPLSVSPLYPIGVLVLARKVKYGFSKPDIRLFKELAINVGDVLMQYRTSRIHRMLGLNVWELGAYRNTYEQLVQQAVDALEAAAGVLWIRTENDGGLDAVAAKNVLRQDLPATQRADSPLFDRLLSSVHPVVEPDLCEVEDELDARWLTQHLGFRNMLGCRLVVGEEVLGVLCVFGRSTYEFSPLEVDALRVLSNQAAIAVQNQRLFDDVAKKAEELSAFQARIANSEQVGFFAVRSTWFWHSIKHKLLYVIESFGGLKTLLEKPYVNPKMLDEYRVEISHDLDDLRAQILELQDPKQRVPKALKREVLGNVIDDYVRIRMRDLREARVHRLDPYDLTEAGL